MLITELRTGTMETAFDTLLKRLLTEDLSKSTILDLASQSKDKQLLVEDLLLASYGKLFNGMKEAAGGIRREGITYLDTVGSAKREPIPSYMLHYGTKDWKPIERIKEVAKIICDEYGLDWMEADSPTLQELETKRDSISKDLELVLKKPPGYIPGQIKPEDYYKWLQEITDRAETAALEAALAKGLSQEAAQALAADVVPLELEAESLAQSLAEITAEIEQARQQEAERAAAEPETEPEESEQETDYCPKKRNQQFKTWIKKRETFESINGYLVCQNYIDDSTTVDQWLWVCGLSEDPQPKIKWITSVELFVYFIQTLFEYKDKAKKDTQKNHWAKALNTFELPKSEKGKQCTNLSLAQIKNKVSDQIIHGADKETCDLLNKAIAEALKLEE